jgi:hypothetical protein
LPESALTRIPRTDNARIKARMAYSTLLKSLDDFAFKTDVGSRTLNLRCHWPFELGIK